MSAPNRKVAWIKPQEPSFLKAFKAKVGYKEPDTIEAKRPKVAPAGAREGDDEEREDELPTVVMLEEGDVGEEEYKRFREAMKEMKKVEEEKDGEDGGSGVSAASPQSSAGDQQSEGDSGRIIFKRPAKRRRSSEGVLDASTKKAGGEAPPSRGPGSKNKSPKTRKRSGSSSGVKNSSLLSFGDEEEEDD